MKPHNYTERRRPRMPGTVYVMLLSLGAVTMTSEASANGFTLRVDAPIIAVEPVLQEPPPVCDLPAPSPQEGLVATLRWDLYGRCRPSEEEAVVSAYRVDYEWDGQRFSTLLNDKPAGKTLPLKLQIQ